MHHYLISPYYHPTNIPKTSLTNTLIGESHLVKQEVVMKPVDLGGLGLGSLRLRNKTFLAKWLRHFFLKPDTRHRVIVSRYVLHPFKWCGCDGFNFSRALAETSRKQLLRVFHFFLILSIVLLEKAQKLNFWEDHCMRDKPLCILFMHLYHILNKMCF